MRYDAFISYRHSDLDMYIAKRIHKGLETFKVPRAVAKKTGKKNIKRVFRDQEELPIGSDLGDNIERALAESEYLLVICSPRTPESYWVQKEITTFIEMHGREHVLAVLVEGEPDESFPKQLLTDDEGNPVEPLAADVRGNTKGERNKKLKTEIMRLAAPLLHCSYDDLRQRHRERKMKKIAAATAAISVTVTALALAFGAYNAYNAAIIQQNYEGKQRNQSKYLADTSLRLLEEGDRRAAVLVALEALPSEENDRPYVAEAQYALSEALYAYDAGSAMKMDRVMQHDLPVKEFNVNADGNRAVSVDQGSNVYVWDVVTGEKLAQIAPRINEFGYIEAPVSAYVYEDTVILCEEHALRGISLDGQENWKVETELYYIDCVVDEAAQIIACVANEEVVFYELSTGEKIGNMPNRQEGSYSSESAFNEDKSKFAVSHYNSDNEVLSGCVTVYDFATKEIIDVETCANYITDIAFTADDCLVVAQANNEDLLNISNRFVDGYVQKIDYQQQAVLWQDSYSYDLISNESASAQVKCRKYKDEATGEVRDEVLLSVDNWAYTWDNITGERKVEVQVDSGIVNFFISTNSRFGYLAQYDGTVDIVDMTAGTRYSASAIETGKEVRQLSIRNGRIVFRAYASPNLTVMKYPDHAKVQELATYDESIEVVNCSAEETYYAVNLYDFDVSSRISFHKVSDSTYMREWVEEDGKYYEVSGFIDDRVYVVMYSDGTVMFYDAETGEKEPLVLGEDLYSVDYAMNRDKTLAVAYQADKYMIVDLQQRKVSSTGEVDGYLYGAVLSEDGSKIICSVKEKGVCIIDVANGQMTPIEQPGYQVFSGSEIQDTLAVSNQGDLVAVGCTDGVLRVLDMAEQVTIAEISFTGVSRSFIRFTDDDTKLMLQGDDYYFRVFDLEKNSFCYVATEQYYEIRDIVKDTEKGIIGLITISEMVLLNAEDYQRVAEIEDGEAYLPKHGLILTDDNGTMYQFPYMTLEMLQAEAKEQFGGEELTESERIKYNVE